MVWAARGGLARLCKIALCTHGAGRQAPGALRRAHLGYKGRKASFGGVCYRMGFGATARSSEWEGGANQQNEAPPPSTFCTRAGHHVPQGPVVHCFGYARAAGNRPGGSIHCERPSEPSVARESGKWLVGVSRVVAEQGCKRPPCAPPLVMRCSGGLATTCRLAGLR